MQFIEIPVSWEQKLFSEVEALIKEATLANSAGKWCREDVEDEDNFFFCGQSRKYYNKSQTRNRILNCVNWQLPALVSHLDKEEALAINYFWGKMKFSTDKVQSSLLKKRGLPKEQKICCFNKPNNLFECSLILLLYIDQKNHKHITYEDYSSTLKEKIPSLEFLENNE